MLRIREDTRFSEIKAVFSNFRRRLSSFSFLLLGCLLLSSFSFSAAGTWLLQDESSGSFFLTLIGVVVSADSSSSVAILKNEKQQKTILLNTGGTVFDFKLVSVEKEGIVLEKEGARHRIFVGDIMTLGGKKREKNPAERSAQAVEMKSEQGLSVNSPSSAESHGLIRMDLVRSDVEKRIRLEWPVMMKETKFVPNYLNGQVSGFKIISLPDKGIFSETGILENDVIKKVNGIELNDLATLFRLYDVLKGENQVEVCIERGGEPYRLLFILK